MGKNPEASTRLGPRAALLGAGVLAIVLFDQLTKIVASRTLDLGQTVPVIPGFIHFTLVRNTGMAFGLLSSSDIPFKSVLVTLASILALSAVSYYALRSPHGEKMTRLGLTFILGGAFGNIIDRARLGYVVDFVDVFIHDAHWPAFNVADTSICIGVGLLLLDSLRSREPALRSGPEVATDTGRGEP